MKTKKSIRKIFSSAFLAAVVLATSLQLPFLTTSAGAETVTATAVTTAPDTEIVGIDSFTEENFTQNFKAWGLKTPTATVSNGVLKVTGSITNSRSAAYMVQTATLNQYVSMTVETTSGENITPVLWLRAQEYDRTSPAGDNIVPIGYLVKAVINGSNSVNVQLFKSAVVGGTFKGDQSLSVETGNINLESSSTAIGLMDLKIEAYINYDAESKTDVIWVNVYKVNKTSGEASIVKTLRYENTEDTYLMEKGWAGFAAMGSTNQLAVKSFDYHSTDTGFDKTLYATESFADYSANMTAFGNNTNASVSEDNNTLIINGTGLNNDRDAAQVLKKAAQNLSVEATIKTPHTLSGSDKTHVKTAPVVWLKSFEITRNTGSKALVGYFIGTSFNSSNDFATVTLYKQTYDNSNKLQDRVALGTVNNVDTLSYTGTVYCDITYKADIKYNSETGATDITVEVYKDINLINTITYSDTDAKLSGAGSAGLSAQQGSATFTKFAVKTQAEALQPAYAQPTIARANTMLAQAVTVDTSATYRFSAVVSGDFTESPLCIAYKTSSGVVLKEFKPSEEAMTDKHYLRYTYDVDMSALGVSDTLVYVGVKLPSSATDNRPYYSEFEFRKVTGETVGANLIFNGDFKMGCCGWTSEVADMTSSISLKTPRTVDSAKFESTYKRFAYYRETNLVNYQRNFINDYYMGDVNEDSYFDIRDLVALNNGIANGEYLIFGDLDNDNTLAVSDLAQLRSDLLGGKNDSKNQ